MARPWIESGTSFEIEWGGETWSLRPDAPRPGLYRQGIGPILGLEGVAAVGRWDREALSAPSLVEVGRHFDRIEATYRPPSWGDLTVRAAWSPIEPEGIHLEIQILALSVDELHAIEIKLLSELGPLPPAGSHRSVEPRDARSAALTYDGRESDLSALVTGPPGDGFPPWLVPKVGPEGWTYAEMVHPDDASRRIHEGRLPFLATRYGLFGYDLEKGVVLRGRIRGFWLPKASAHDQAISRYGKFLNEDLPLRT